MSPPSHEVGIRLETRDTRYSAGFLLVATSGKLLTLFHNGLIRWCGVLHVVRAHSQAWQRGAWKPGFRRDLLLVGTSYLLRDLSFTFLCNELAEFWKNFVHLCIDVKMVRSTPELLQEHVHVPAIIP